MVWIGCRQLAECATHGLMESTRFAFQAIEITVEPSRRSVSGDLEQDNGVGPPPGDGPIIDLSHWLDAEAPAAALVGERRIGRPIGHNVSAAVEARQHNLVKVLSSICGHQQRLGPRSQWRLFGMQQEPAQLLTQYGSARFEGNDAAHTLGE
jgi:hypothetical protein